MIITYRSYFYHALITTFVHGHFFESSLSDFSNCQNYYSRHESKYKVFFRFDEQQTQHDRDKSLYVDFHFSVLAISDAHILLAPSINVSNNENVYEVVIGAGGNTFSDIRRKQKSSVRASIRRTGILSPVDIRSFWIHVHKNGTINVGIEGVDSAFLSWTDPDLLPIQVFSFSGMPDVESKWFFDCPRPHSNIREQFQTETEKLRKLLLRNYDNSSRPVYNVSKTTEIQLNILSNSIFLDEEHSTFNFRGHANLMWTDEKLSWKPEGFGNNMEIVVHSEEIWTPNIIVSNAVGLENFQPFKLNLLRVHYTGQVKSTTNFDICALCEMNGIDDWPMDTHKCFINLDILHGSNLLLRYRALEKNNNSLNTNNSVWKLINSTHEYNNITEIDSLYRKPALRLEFIIQRNSKMHFHILLTPFFVLSTLILLSYWSCPFGYFKFMFLAAQFLINSIVLINILLNLPTHSSLVPFIVYLYTGLIISNIVSLMLATVVINLARIPKHRLPTHWMLQICYNEIVEKLLLLRGAGAQFSNVNGRENSLLSLQQLAIQESWIRIGTMIDRIAWISFSILLAVILGHKI